MGSGSMNSLMPLLMLLMGGQGGGMNGGGNGNPMSALLQLIGGNGANPFGSGASGGGTMVPMSYGSSPMMSGGSIGAPEEQYFQYLSQALPNIMNGINAGTIRPGQTLQNFQGPQAFGIPSSGF